MNDVYANLESLRFTVSGANDLWSIGPDEAVVLSAYRGVREEGRGSVFVEFNDFHISKWEVKHAGGASFLNSLLPGTKRCKE